MSNPTSMIITMLRHMLSTEDCCKVIGESTEQAANRAAVEFACNYPAVVVVMGAASRSAEADAQETYAELMETYVDWCTLFNMKRAKDAVTENDDLAGVFDIFDHALMDIFDVTTEMAEELNKHLTDGAPGLAEVAATVHERALKDKADLLSS